MTREEMILLAADIGSRIIDKDKPIGKTNLGTISGTTLIGIGAPMIGSPTVLLQVAGAALCLAGVGLIWYREYKENEAEEVAENSEDSK